MNNVLTDVLKGFVISLLLTTLGMALGFLIIPESVASIIPILVLIAMIILYFRRKKITFAELYSLVFLMGGGLFPSIAYYLSAIGAVYVALAFFITCLTFTVLSIYAYKTKRDFTFLGGMLFTSLIVLILLSIVSFFVEMTLFLLLITGFSILVFCGYIVYDINKLKHGNYSQEDVPSLVLDLYLDFINLFLDILRLISILMGDDD